MLILSGLAAAALLYVAIIAVMAMSQRALLYFPDRRRIAPQSLGLGEVEERLLETPDGAALVCWHLPPAPDHPILLYFHGNAGGLVDRAERVPYFRAAGIGVFMVSYRGYSGGKGRPSEAHNLADAELAWRALREMGYREQDIALYGESLGTFIAASMALAHPARALILEAPYTSIVDIARWRFPFVPAGRLMKERYETDAIIARVRIPLLIVHGERDGIVPFRFGQRLFALAGEPKIFADFPGAGHTNLYRHGAFARIAAFAAAPSPAAHS